MDGARRRWRWLLAAGLLFAVAAFVMAVYDEPPPPPPRVTLPRFMDGEARERLQRRRTLPARPAEKGPWDEPREEGRPRLVDPVIRAMPASVKRAAIVVEANALRHSPVGQLVIDCFVKRGNDLEALKGKTGIDVLKDVDRVSVFDDTFLLTGQFQEAKWQQVFEGTSPTVMNPNTTLWEPAGKDDSRVAVWKNQMVIMGETREAIAEVVARLEGTAPPHQPILSEHESYGEIYGVVAPAALADLLAAGQEDLAGRLRQVVDRIGLHVDASHDVGIVADATGAGQGVGDLARSIGAALSIGRLAAQAQGNKNLAEVLEYARVVPGDETAFRTELALPLAFFEEKLRDCARGTDRSSARTGAARPDAR